MTDSPVRTRGFLSLVLIVVSLLGLVISGLLWSRGSDLTDKPFSLNNSGTVIVSDEEQHRAVAVAEQFGLRMNTYTGGDIKAYTDSISELLTTKFRDTFIQSIEAAQQVGLGPQDGIAAEARIQFSGVSDIDPDSATVLVAVDAAFTSSSGVVERHFRWRVELRKVAGDWLVDSWTSLS